MESLRYLRLSFSVLLFAGALVFALAQAEAPNLWAVAGQMSKWPLVDVAAIMFAGSLLAAWRFQRVAADLGYRLGFREAVSVYGCGQLAGILFFQLPGQLLARGAMLARCEIPVSGTVVITGYERLASLIVSLCLAGLAAVYLFGAIHLDLSAGGTDLINVMAGLMAAIVGGMIVGWGRAAVAVLPILDRFNPWLFLRTLALSLLIQLATMTGYILLVTSIEDGVPLASLAAAACLVMLAASLPISFAGWGVRELSAVVALSAVGVSAEASLVTAVLMGVISTAVIGLLLLVGAQTRAAQAASEGRTDAPQRMDYTAILSVGPPLMAATAVFFQVFVPVRSGLLNVNLADPIALLAGAFFVTQHLKRGWPAWRMPGLNAFILLATATVGLAYLNGLLSFGSSDWAFSNRLLGWFVVLSYGATGALLVRQLGPRGLDLLFRTFVGVAAAIVALQCVELIAQRLDLLGAQSADYERFVGMSQNANAFAFLLLLASAAVLAVRDRGSAVLYGILLFGIWYTGSRAALVVLPVALVVAAYMKALSLRDLAKAILVAVAIQIVVAGLPALVLALGPSGADSGSVTQLLVPALPDVSSPKSDNERWTSVADGWQMFLSHPLFGAGLGAFMQSQLAAGHALVIHSTPVWLLAEMGSLGFACMAAPIVTMFVREALSRPFDAAGRGVVLIIATFAVFGLVHDIMYQRGFWLLLGAAVAARSAGVALEKNGPDAASEAALPKARRRLGGLVPLRRG